MPRTADDAIGFRIARDLKQHWEAEARKDKRTLSQWLQLMVDAGEKSLKRQGRKRTGKP